MGHTNTFELHEGKTRSIEFRQKQSMIEILICLYMGETRVIDWLAQNFAHLCSIMQIIP